MKLELRLSEAIFLGFHTVSSIAKCDADKCALPMALNAVGIPLGKIHEREDKVLAAWPWLRDWEGKKCPFCEWTLSYPSGWLVPHLFDAHVMGKIIPITIEQMCDWIRSIEPVEPSISILPSRQPLVRIPEGSDQGDEQPEWDDTDTSRELYSGIKRGCQ